MANNKKSRSNVSPSQGKPDSSLLSGFGEEKGGLVETCGWDEASPEQIARLAVAVVSFGGACMFGRSRSGEVLSITVFLDGDKRTRWIRPEEDPDAVIELLVKPFEAAQ